MAEDSSRDYFNFDFFLPRKNDMNYAKRMQFYLQFKVLKLRLPLCRCATDILTEVVTWI